MRWYNGSARFVCSKTTPPNEVEDRWAEKKKQLDAAATEEVVKATARRSLRLIELASTFYEFNDQRVATGKPKRMSPFTARDYERTINALGRAIGPDKPIAELGPSDFDKFAAAIAGSALSRFAVDVAYVRAFMAWGLRQGHFAENRTLARLAAGQDPLEALVGASMVKPPDEDLRDEQVDRDASYSPNELRRLWAVADDTMRLWMGLGLNSAFDNADLANLIKPCLDLTLGRTDFRRRKRGKIRRVAPLMPKVFELATAYKRPALANDTIDDDLVFATPTGLPLQRLSPGGGIDYVAMRWGKLLQRAGIRPATIITRDKETGKRTYSMPDGYVADRRGFRGLRTTFPNLAPPDHEEEVEIIMGHRHTVLLDYYLKRVGWERLAFVVTHAWHRAFSCPRPLDAECRCGKLDADGKPLKKTRQTTRSS